jgi:hypothetical protein
VLQDLVIGEPKDSDPQLAEPFRPALVISLLRRFQVLSAVDFDDERALVAEEVDDIARNRMLPPKFEPGKSSGPNNRPHPSLRISGLPAHPSRVAKQPAIVVVAPEHDRNHRPHRNITQDPHPNPLPEYRERGKQVIVPTRD